MNITKRIVCFFFAVLMCCSVFPVSAIAAAVSNPMHDTYVVNDLNTMGYNTSEYPRDTSDSSVRVIDFTEYGYDYYGDQRYYGLYIYIYNPSGREIATGGNFVELAYNTEGGLSSGYIKYGLQMLSRSADPGNENVLYKFLITTSRSIAKKIQRGVREYSLSSLEITFSDAVASKPESYTLGGKYSFEGYQKYFGMKDEYEQTLFRRYEQFEVAEITLNAASWFTSKSDLGNDYRYELSSVYFAIPDYFIRKYGDISDNPKDGGTSGLYAVKGEYYRYLTNGLVTNDRLVYTQFLPYVDRDISHLNGYENGTTGEGYGFHSDRYSLLGTSSWQVELSYNVKTNTFFSAFSSLNQLSNLYNVLLFDFDDDLCVSQDSFYEQYISLGGNKTYFDTYFCSDHFSSVDTGREYFNISVDDKTFSDAFSTYKKTYTKWYHKFFDNDLFQEANNSVTVEPIREITDSDVGVTSNADNLFIMDDDLTKLKSFYNENDSGNHIYLLRLDVTPYYCPEVNITNNSASENYGKGFYFEKAIYEDIDVFEFVFRDADANFHTVPVSCKPIDNVGAVIPGNNGVADNNGNPRGDDDQELSWFTVLILVIVLIVFLFIVWLFWKVFGGMLMGITDISVALAGSRRERKQQKLDNYDKEQKIKADKKKKRKDKKSKKKDPQHTHGAQEE